MSVVKKFIILGVKKRLRRFTYSEDSEIPVEFRSSFQILYVKSTIRFSTWHFSPHLFDFFTIAFNCLNSIISEIYFISLYIILANLLLFIFSYLFWSIR